MEIDDGARLKVGDQVLFDQPVWFADMREGKIKLEAFKKYPIEINYKNKDGNACCQLFWESASQSKQIVPGSQLYPPRPPTR